MTRTGRRAAHVIAINTAFGQIALHPFVAGGLPGIMIVRCDNYFAAAVAGLVAT